MTTTQPSPTLECFDFSKPARLSSDHADQWQHWLEQFAQDFREKWLQLANVEIETRIGDQAALEFEVVRQRLPRPAIAWEFEIGEQNLPTLLVFDRPLALGLVMQLLGEQEKQLPEDRPLSAIEHSLCEMLFRRIIDSLSESWPQKDPLACHMKEVDQYPHRSRLWEPRKTVYTCNLDFGFGEGSSLCQWILPQEELEGLLEKLDVQRVELTEDSRQRMEERARDVPVPVTVEIGRISVPVSRLANLAAGDVMVFEQRIQDPLPLVVAGKKKFYGWLGRTGNRQAFKVTEVCPNDRGARNE